MDGFTRVKQMIAELGLRITDEDPEEELVVVEDEDRGIKGMIIDCENEFLLIEQPIGKFSQDTYHWFLEKNRELSFGAFALDADSRLVLFRNTLRLDTLDLEELESTINSLEIFFAEHGSTLLDMAQK